MSCGTRSTRDAWHPGLVHGVPLATTWCCSAFGACCQVPSHWMFLKSTWYWGFLTCIPMHYNADPEKTVGPNPAFPTKAKNPPEQAISVVVRDISGDFDFTPKN